MTTKDDQRWNFRDLMENPLYEQLIDLQVQNERLRAALQEIVDHPAPSHVNNVAREALSPR